MEAATLLAVPLGERSSMAILAIMNGATTLNCALGIVSAPQIKRVKRVIHN